MARLPSTVRPGDVISAELMNGLLAKCRDLESRVASLETEPGAGKPEIIFPTPFDAFFLGDELRVAGRNFGRPADNTVFLDTTIQINQFKSGSNNRLLIFDIPFVQNVSSVGRSVPLTVSNEAGFASTSLILRERAPTVPTGTLVVAQIGSLPPGTTIEAGGTYVFNYSVSAATTLGDIYNLSPSVDAGWPARIVNAAGQPVVPPQVFIPKPSTPTVPTVVPVRVEVTVPSGVPAGTTGNLALTVRSQKNPTGVFGTSDATPLTVDEEAPPAEAIAISLDTVFAGQIQGDTIVVPGTAPVFATFKAVVPEAGAYSIDQPYTFENDPSGAWSASHTGSTASGIFMQPPQALFTVQLTAAAGAPEARLNIKIVSDTDPTVFGDIQQKVRLGS